MISRLFAHELGHAVVAICVGGTVSQIRLRRDGGRTYWRLPTSAPAAVLPVLVGGVAADWVVYSRNPWRNNSEDLLDALDYLQRIVHRRPDELLAEVGIHVQDAINILWRINFPNGFEHLERGIGPGRDYCVIKGSMIKRILEGG